MRFVYTFLYDWILCLNCQLIIVARFFNLIFGFFYYGEIAQVLEGMKNALLNSQEPRVDSPSGCPIVTD